MGGKKERRASSPDPLASESGGGARRDVMSTVSVPRSHTCVLMMCMVIIARHAHMHPSSLSFETVVTRLQADTGTPCTTNTPTILILEYTNS